MNARQFKTGQNLSAVDFPAIKGLGQSTLGFRTETPILVDNKLKLTITMTYILGEVLEKKTHQVLSATSVYEIPAINIKERETVYEFYKDATSFLNEAFAFAKRSLPLLPEITFPAPPIDSLQKEIGGVLYLVNTLN